MEHACPVLLGVGHEGEDSETYAGLRWNVHVPYCLSQMEHACPVLLSLPRYCFSLYLLAPRFRINANNAMHVTVIATAGNAGAR